MEHLFQPGDNLLAQILNLFAQSSDEGKTRFIESLIPNTVNGDSVITGSIDSLYNDSGSAWSDMATDGFPITAIVNPCDDSSGANPDTDADSDLYIKLNEFPDAAAGLICDTSSVIGFVLADKREAVPGITDTYYDGYAIHAACGDGDADKDAGGAIMRLFRFAPNAISTYTTTGTHTIATTDSQPFLVICIGGGGAPGDSVSGSDTRYLIYDSGDSPTGDYVDVTSFSCGGGGGGGGATVIALVNGPPSHQYTVTIGAGGADAGTGIGGSTSFVSTAGAATLNLIAVGGLRGIDGDHGRGGTGGAGGAYNSCTASGTQLVGNIKVSGTTGQSGSDSVLIGNDSYTKEGVGGHSLLPPWGGGSYTGDGTAGIVFVIR